MANGRRWFRRKEEPLTASAQKVSLGDHDAVKNVLNNRKEWQTQAWDVFDAVGQVKYGAHALASLISRVILFPAEPPESLDNSTPQATKDKRVIETFQRLGNLVRRTDLQHDLALNLLIVGECWLICRGPREAEVNELGEVKKPAHEEIWFVRSIDEIKWEGDTVSVIDLYDANVWMTLDHTKGDTAIRIWRAHPRHHHEAEAHVRGILTSAEELLWWDAAAQARAKSRLSDSGVWAIPQNLEVPAQSDDPEGLTGSQRFLKRFQKAQITAIRNPGSAEAATPILVTYPPNEQGKSGIEPLVLERPQDELLDKRTDRCLSNIEQGINLPAGVVSGLGEASHWGGGQIEESLFREHVEPLVLLVISALTSAFLHPLLRELGVDPSKYLVWYDASNLIVHQDRAGNAIRAVELGLISRSAARRELGFSSTDAPTPEELEEVREWISSIRRGSSRDGIVDNPQTSDDPGDPTGSPSRPTRGSRAPEDQPAAPLRRTGQPVIASANGHSSDLSAIDMDLISRLQVMCDEKVRRALEKAGNKLRSRANKVPAYKEALRGVRGSEAVATTLGREAVNKLGADDLFDGCWTDVPSRLVSFCDSALEVRNSIQPTSPLDYRRQMEAGKKLASTLTEIATNALFSPAECTYLVPATVIATTLAEAGYRTLDVLAKPPLAT